MAPVPTQWHAPLPIDAPDGGLKASTTSDWWARFDDPTLMHLVVAGEAASASLAEAAARMADARAARTSPQASLLPTLDASLTANRGVDTPGEGAAATSSLGLQAAWELDVFGANRAGASAAGARFAASEAGWHLARIAVGIEVASNYLALRACEAQRSLTEVHAASRAETHRLTGIAAGAGLQASATAVLAQASMLQGRALLAQQRATCDRLLKSLVALTATEERALRLALDMRTALLPQPPSVQLRVVPAQALRQRPDIAMAEREVVAAHADVDQAHALRWPRITLSGSIGTARERTGGFSVDGSVWSIGPVTVTLPLFDAGVRRANADAAQSRFAAAKAAYASRLRDAVREVETALVALHSASTRADDARAAARGFERSYAAVDQRYRAGLASLFELEDARRGMVAAQGDLMEQQREAVQGWIDLYRATGGDWTTWPNALETPP